MVFGGFSVINKKLGLRPDVIGHFCRGNTLWTLCRKCRPVHFFPRGGTVGFMSSKLSIFSPSQSRAAGEAQRGERKRGGEGGKTHTERPRNTHTHSHRPRQTHRHTHTHTHTCIHTHTHTKGLVYITAKTCCFQQKHSEWRFFCDKQKIRPQSQLSWSFLQLIHPLDPVLEVSACALCPKGRDRQLSEEREQSQTYRSQQAGERRGRGRGVPTHTQTPIHTHKHREKTPTYT